MKNYAVALSLFNRWEIFYISWKHALFKNKNVIIIKKVWKIKKSFTCFAPNMEVNAVQKQKSGGKLHTIRSPFVDLLRRCRIDIFRILKAVKNDKAI